MHLELGFVWKFAVGQNVFIVGGGALTPATVVDRERYMDSRENYKLEWVAPCGPVIGWVMDDDLMPNESA